MAAQFTVGEIEQFLVEEAALLEPAARSIGGGAGGKDILANAGGTDAEKVPEALGGIPSRVRELLGGR